MHIIAAKAVAFGEALKPEFRDYQEQIILNARALSGNLIKLGYHLVSGGTDNHLILMDLSNIGVTGKDAEKALGKAGITVNKNTVPFDTQSPFITSGIRLGTPAVTTRGMKEKEMDILSVFIDSVLKNIDNDLVIKKVRKDVENLCRHYMLYPELGK